MMKSSSGLYLSLLLNHSKIRVYSKRLTNSLKILCYRRAVIPPVAHTVSPVIYFDSSDARNVTKPAISSGSPILGKILGKVMKGFRMCTVNYEVKLL